MTPIAGAAPAARRIHVRGVVQGVGFRPHVFRLAHAHGLRGWVRNGADGVHIHVEGTEDAIERFVGDLRADPPPAAAIAGVDVSNAGCDGLASFEIRASDAEPRPTTRLSPDLPVCRDCLRELFDPGDRRHAYPYINCTNCGPRFSIVRALPYDRARTTMAPWPLCARCAAEYADPLDRRFHAQPVACAECGPAFSLIPGAGSPRTADQADAIREAARLLRDGRIVAVKGIGGYHLACDAANLPAILRLRERKFRKDQAFAIMVAGLEVADRTVFLTDDARALLTSMARPIVIAPAREPLPGVAPDSDELGVMLPYTPLHHLLFAAGSPERLVMTSGNRSSEPIAYDDEDALTRLDGLADAWLVGGRAIARRVDDSVMRAGVFGPTVLRRSRGLAPGSVAALPPGPPILALGADLKNTITLVVDGQAYVSQHIGDLSHHASLQAFRSTVRDFLAMYGLSPDEVTIVHDAHPQYVSTAEAAALGAKTIAAVQHHRAHLASVLAERGELDRRVAGVAFDGTGYGDDGTIWGGELFGGSVRGGFERVGHLHPACLPGGDAAAHHPVQAAAGYLSVLPDSGDLTGAPFDFPKRYEQAAAVVRSGVRTFATTSAGRLFDTVAALVGFTRPTTFEGQAAMWLEHLARQAPPDTASLSMPFIGGVLDWRPTLVGILEARRRGADPAALARAFHRALASGIARAIREICVAAGVEIAVLSGGVMQNELLLEDLRDALEASPIRIWTNRLVPANDGGISLGQAATLARVHD
ncbi:MAG TPA: carbamoyltransferase HypF [Vicinamibacterales bacterium]